MKQIDKDRKELQRLVEAYGKQDVTKFINHINEAIDESQTKKAAILKAYNEIDFEQDSPDDLMRILEELYDTAADEGYQLGYDEAEKNSEKKIKALEKRVSDAGWQYEYDHHDDWRKPREMGQW